MGALLSARIGLRQPEPPKPEGRAAYVVNPFTFVTGNEVFIWDASAQGIRVPSAILSAWVDPTGLAAGQQFFIDTGYQIIPVPQNQGPGYVIITSPNPFKAKLYASAGVAGTCKVIFYNYNVFATGTEDLTAYNPGASSANGGRIASKKNVIR